MANGPALRRRHARYGREGTERIRVDAYVDAGVRRGDDGPGDPVPPLGESLNNAGTGPVVSDRPARGGRHARHAIKNVLIRGAGVGGGNDGPCGPVPPL